MKRKIFLGLSVFCQFTAKVWIMVQIALYISVFDITSGVLLLVLPITFGWAATLLLQRLLKSDFCMLSTKDKLIHLLSSTWFTLPVRRMEDRDQRHKGRETFFGLLLAGINLVGTSAAMMTAIGLEDPGWFNEHVLLIFGSVFPSLFFHLAGCALLLLFEKTVHPWRHLGKERQSNCWGKLQGTKRGIEAEPTIWDQVSVHYYT